MAEQQPETVGISGGHPHQHWDAAVVEDVLADGRGEPLTCAVQHDAVEVGLRVEVPVENTPVMPASAATATKACLDALKRLPKRLLPWTTGRPSAPMTLLGTRSMSRYGLNRVGVLHVEGVAGTDEAESESADRTGRVVYRRDRRQRGSALAGAKAS